MNVRVCHFCRRRRPDLVQSPRDPSMWWCPPRDVDCNFRARRRLGVPYVTALEAKVREADALGLTAVAIAARRALIAALLEGRG